MSSIMKNRYANTLHALASDQGASFYKGEIAKDIVDTVQSATGNQGRLDLEDLADIASKNGQLRIAYRDLDVAVGTSIVWRFNCGTNSRNARKL